MRNSSLFSYLQSGQHPFSLKISLHTENPSILEKTKFPFLLIHDSDPFGRLLEAKLVTDADIEFRSLFLFVQKDHYFLPPNELWPVNNKDVENSWQKAFDFYRRTRQGDSFMVLADQIGEQGRFQPLQSLFFCKTRRVFFHPICPRCGLALQQCNEDKVLENCGLPLYSTSLKRYLFCPSCFLKGFPDFYVNEADKFDPPQIKDRSALIREFGQIQEIQSQEEPMPCRGCPNHGECYGPALHALTRITPFSFYPFFLFIFDAAFSLNAMDFLSLVSGGSFAEIETQLQAKGELGRIRYLKLAQQEGKEKPPSFFEKGEGEFGEVFYLKLSFLEELIRNISSRGGFRTHPDLRLGVDRIWVKLANPGSLLPFFWNFQIDLMEVAGVPQESAPLLPSPKSNSLYFLSCLWFYTLLVNKNQNISEVYQSLGKALEQPPSNFDFSSPSPGNPMATFLPQNIFWDPGKKKVAGKWNPLWEKSLNLGFSLMKTSVGSDPQWQEDDFLNQLDSLRQAVRESLFTAGLAESKQDILLANGALVKILSNIRQKWQKQARPIRDGLAETMILPSRRTREEVPSEDEALKTVILSPQGGREGASTKEELEKTIIVSRESLTRESSKSSSQNISIENTTQTVVISPHDSPSSPFSQFSRKNLEARKEKDSLPGGRPREKVQEERDEDYLSQTVVLRAKTTKERKESKD
jgi:hypothetical protein